MRWKATFVAFIPTLDIALLGSRVAIRMPSNGRKFLIPGQGWEFLNRETNKAEFPIHIIWGKVINDKVIIVTLSQQEQAHVERVYS